MLQDQPSRHAVRTALCAHALLTTNMALGHFTGGGGGYGGGGSRGGYGGGSYGGGGYTDSRYDRGGGGGYGGSSYGESPCGGNLKVFRISLSAAAMVHSNSSSQLRAVKGTEQQYTLPRIGSAAVTVAAAAAAGC